MATGKFIDPLARALAHKRRFGDRGKHHLGQVGVIVVAGIVSGEHIGLHMGNAGLAGEIEVLGCNQVVACSRGEGERVRLLLTRTSPKLFYWTPFGLQGKNKKHSFGEAMSIPEKSDGGAAPNAVELAAQSDPESNSSRIASAVFFSAMNTLCWLRRSEGNRGSKESHNLSARIGTNTGERRLRQAWETTRWLAVHREFLSSLPA